MFFLVGITAYTKRGHVARATLEATCFQTKAILDAMEKDSKHTLTELAVDGGMSNSDLTMQVRNVPKGIRPNPAIYLSTDSFAFPSLKYLPPPGRHVPFHPFN